MSKLDEIIIVAARSNVFENEEFVFQGVESDKEKVNKIIENISRTYEAMRRGNAEEDTNYKQPIPYCVIRKGDLLYAYERLKGGGETRLHSKLSLGAGGHMNLTQHQDFEEIMHDNLLRELEEELDIKSFTRKFTTVGLINDDENEVGRVHIGVLVILDLDKDADVSVRETEQLKGEWMSLDQLISPDTYARLEPWSKFVVDMLS